MRLTPLLATLVLSATARAADTAAVDLRLAKFTLDFCGNLIGSDPRRLESEAKSLEAIVLGPPELIPDAPPGARAAVAESMKIDPDTPVHRAEFAELPAGMTVHAFVRPDLKGCEVIVVGPTNSKQLVIDRLSQASATWKETASPFTWMRVWQRQDRNPVVIIQVSSDPEVTSFAVSTSP